MIPVSNPLPPKLDELGRWTWPDPDCERTDDASCGPLSHGFDYLVEEHIAALADLPDDVIQQVSSPLALRSECLTRFRQAAFSLQTIEEHLAVQNATGIVLSNYVALQKSLDLKNYLWLFVKANLICICGNSLF